MIRILIMCKQKKIPRDSNSTVWKSLSAGETCRFTETGSGQLWEMGSNMWNLLPISHWFKFHNVAAQDNERKLHSMELESYSIVLSVANSFIKKK